MKLSTFILKRLFFSLIVLFGLSILIFLIARVVPGDPVRLAFGARAPDHVVEKMREEMHLNDPIFVQYIIWFRNALRGDFGKSLFTRQDVFTDIKEFLPATLELALVAGIIMSVMGILLGSISAQFKNSWIDNGVRIFSYIGVVTPAFVFAVLFVLLFGYVFELLPTAGRLSGGLAPPTRITGMLLLDSLLTGNFAVFFDALKHVIMPAASLSMAGMAQQSRITRGSMSDNFQKDYILAHKTYGIPKKTILFKYLLKPSLIPTVSILGLDFAALLGNAFLVELVFNWPGISRYGINAILRKDLNVVTAVVMILGISFVTINIIVDIVVAYLDPRIRMGREGK